MQRRKELEAEYTNPFTMAATALSPAESALSYASFLSVLSQLSILNSDAPLLGQATAVATTTSPYSISPTPTPTPSTPSPTNNQAEESQPSTSSPTTYTGYGKPTSTNGVVGVATSTPVDFNTGDNSGWENMEKGTHVGVILSIIAGIVLIVALSFWFCCGGRAWWSRKHDHHTDAGGLPLYTVRNGRNTQAGVHRPGNEGMGGLGGDAPPVYEEVAPPQHQTLARGVGLRSAEEVQREEVEEAVVSDGKTPLSEIPFEDVVLERHPSESESSSSASRGFEMRHHAMGGDTRGHTNT